MKSEAEIREKLKKLIHDQSADLADGMASNSMMGSYYRDVIEILRWILEIRNHGGRRVKETPR